MTEVDSINIPFIVDYFIEALDHSSLYCGGSANPNSFLIRIDLNCTTEIPSENSSEELNETTSLDTVGIAVGVTIGGLIFIGAIAGMIVCILILRKRKTRARIQELGNAMDMEEVPLHLNPKWNIKYDELLIG